MIFVELKSIHAYGIDNSWDYKIIMFCILKSKISTRFKETLQCLLFSDVYNHNGEMKLASEILVHLQNFSV